MKSYIECSSKRKKVPPGYITHQFPKKCINPKIQPEIGKNCTILPRFTLIHFCSQYSMWINFYRH